MNIIRDIEVTLYDIFGYLIPGSVALMGVYLIAWRIILPVNQDWTGASGGAWFVVLGVAYLMGHFAQALSNLVFYPGSKGLSDRVLKNRKEIPEGVVSFAKEAAGLAVGLPETFTPKEKALYDIMDHYLQQHGKTETRDIYVYREGFYRGVVVALSLLAIGAFVRMTGVEGSFAAFGTKLTVTKGCMGFVCILSVIMALSANARYRRFTVYRVKNALYSFLAIQKQVEQEHRGAQKEGKEC